MGFWSRILGSQPDALTVSDQLSWLVDCELEFSRKLTQKEIHSSKALALYTVVASAKTGINVLHFEPRSVKRISEVLCEARHFFDCLWQLVVLAKFHGAVNQKKTGILAAWVYTSTDQLLSNASKQNPPLEPILSAMVGEQYYKRSDKRVAEYIHGELSTELMNLSDDTLIRNTMHLTHLLRTILLRSGLTLDLDELGEVVSIEIASALDMKLITRFDLNKCEVLELPDSFYR